MSKTHLPNLFKIIEDVNTINKNKIYNLFSNFVRHSIEKVNVSEKQKTAKNIIQQHLSLLVCRSKIF